MKRKFPVFRDEALNANVGKASKPWALITSLGAQSFSVLAGILIMALVLAFSRTAHAEVRVEGQIDSVKVEVRDASVREALAALSTTFGLRVHGSATLDQPVSGTYHGSLQQVVARLLAGRSYVTTYSAGKLEIRIFGPGNVGKSRPVADRLGTSVVPQDAALAPVSKPTVDKGRLMFAPR